MIMKLKINNSSNKKISKCKKIQDKNKSILLFKIQIKN